MLEWLAPEMQRNSLIRPPAPVKMMPLLGSATWPWATYIPAPNVKERM